MKIASNILLAAFAAAILAAIWAPGAWWQWGITALLFLLAGAGFGAAADMPRQPTGNHTSTGPHVRFTPTETTIVNRGSTPEQVADSIERHQQKRDGLYGKPSKENDR